MKQMELDPKTLSLISHELRAPLAAIRGNVGLLQTGVFGALSDEAKKTLDQMNTSVIREIYLVHDFGFFLKLYFGEQLSEPAEKLDLLAKVKAVVDFYAKEESKSGKAVFEVEGDSGIEVTLHPWLFGTAVTYLLKYAVRGGADGATVKVAVRSGESGPIITVKDNEPKLTTGADELFKAPRLGSVDRSGIELLVAALAVERLEGFKIGVLPEYEDGNVLYIQAA